MSRLQGDHASSQALWAQRLSSSVVSAPPPPPPSLVAPVPARKTDSPAVDFPPLSFVGANKPSSAGCGGAWNRSAIDKAIQAERTLQAYSAPRPKPQGEAWPELSSSSTAPSVTKNPPAAAQKTQSSWANLAQKKSSATTTAAATAVVPAAAAAAAVPAAQNARSQPAIAAKASPASAAVPVPPQRTATTPSLSVSLSVAAEVPPNRPNASSTASLSLTLAQPAKQTKPSAAAPSPTAVPVATAAAPAKVSYAKMLQVSSSSASASAQAAPRRPPGIAAPSTAPAPSSSAKAAPSPSPSPSAAAARPARETVCVPSHCYWLFRKSRFFLSERLGEGVFVDFPLDEDAQAECAVTLTARSGAALDDALDELEALPATRRAFEQDFELHAMQKTHVFVDNVHLFHPAQLLPNGAAAAAQQRETDLRVALKKVASLVESSRVIAQRAVFGEISWSKSPIWTKWRESKYETLLCGKLEEQMLRAIDETVCAHAHEDRTLVLLTGDTAQSLDRPLLLPVVEKALRLGWQVELWGWKIAVSPEYVKLAAACQRRGGGAEHSASRLRIKLLDDFRDFVTFVKPGETSGGGGGAADSASSERDGEFDVEMLCPITHEVLSEPALTPAGHIYEAHAVLDWISRNGNCPLTRTPLSAMDLKVPPEEFMIRLANYKRRHKLK